MRGHLDVWEIKQVLQNFLWPKEKKTEGASQVMSVDSRIIGMKLVER
jgi:hypothetical protein